MTTYQTSILSYLSERGPQFIEWIASQKDGDTQIVGDMCPVAVRFLETKLRAEMGLYTPNSIRYGDLIDMLIEVKREIPPAFREKLGRIATDFFIGKGEN